jgi:hypothetical protein
MQKPQAAFKVFIDEMGNYVFKFLCFFNGEETILKTTTTTLLCISFLRLEISIHTHEACDSSNIFILECLNQFQDSFRRGFCSNIEQNAYLRIELPTKSLKKPEMRGKFGPICMFKAGDKF